MDKKAIGKAVVSAVALAAATGGMLGLFSGNEPLTYSTKAATAAALLDPAVQDGIYAAESTNNFSTVGAELTSADRRITEVKITSSGDESTRFSERIRKRRARRTMSLPARRWSIRLNRFRTRSGRPSPRRPGKCPPRSRAR